MKQLNSLFVPELIEANGSVLEGGNEFNIW
jgi:hypothetical protein